MIDLIKEEDHHKILVVVAIGGCPRPVFVLTQTSGDRHMSQTPR